MSNAIAADLGPYGGKVNVSDAATFAYALRLLAAVPLVAEWPEGHGTNRRAGSPDPMGSMRDYRSSTMLPFELRQPHFNHLRAVPLVHRHVETGVWQLRIDSAGGDWRMLASGWGDQNPWCDEYRGVDGPDLLPRVVAHYATALLASDYLSTQGLPTDVLEAQRQTNPAAQGQA